MAAIPFPDVPNDPGVPQVPRRPGGLSTGARVALGILQSIIWQALQISTKWGIYNDKGKPLVDTSFFLTALGIGQTLSTNSFTFSKETKVSDFPVEKGSFATYNKVEVPGSPIVVFAFGGTEGQRGIFLNALDAACKSTDLYDVVTPEVTYLDYAIESYNYTRQNTRGTSLLMVEVHLKEVKQVSAKYSTSAQDAKIDKPKDPAATPPVNSGKVQAKTPDTSTLKSLSNKMPGLS